MKLRRRELEDRVTALESADAPPIVLTSGERQDAITRMFALDPEATLPATRRVLQIFELARKRRDAARDD